VCRHGSVLGLFRGSSSPNACCCCMWLGEQVVETDGGASEFAIEEVDGVVELVGVAAADEAGRRRGLRPRTPKDDELDATTSGSMASEEDSSSKPSCGSPSVTSSTSSTTLTSAAAGDEARHAAAERRQARARKMGLARGPTALEAKSSGSGRGATAPVDALTKKQQRMIRNRESAALSRKRKRDQVRGQLLLSPPDNTGSGPYIIRQSGHSPQPPHAKCLHTNTYHIVLRWVRSCARACRGGWLRGLRFRG
jgi:hypothetical protein